MSFFGRNAIDFAVYAGIAAAHLLPGILAGWAAYLGFLAWRRLR